MELTLDQALHKGIEAHRAGQVQEADKCYTAVLKANPKHPDANHNMGVLAVGVGQTDAALPFFKTALEANPNMAQYWLSYIDALIKLDQMEDAQAVFDQAKSNGAKGDGFDQIEKRLNTSSVEFKNQTLEDTPTQGNILDELILGKALKLANKKAKDGLSEDAKKIYQDILKKFPKNKEALDGIKKLATKASANTPDIQEPSDDQFNNLVNLYTQGQYHEALNKGSQLLDPFPNSINLYNILGATYRQLGKLEEAIEAYTKALSLKPDYAEAYNNMGNALKEQGKLKEAIEAFEKAVDIKPDYADAYNNMGIVLRDQGKLEEAIEACTKAFSIKPDYAEAYNIMGSALTDQGKLEEAIEAYNQALSLNPYYAEAYNNLGNAFKDLGKADEARKAFNKALSIKPDYADAYNNMGVALQEHGELDQSIDAFTKAVLIKPDYAEAFYNMGIALKEQGELDKTVEAYTKALSLKPDFAEAYNNMGNVLKEQGKLDEAIQAYDKALNIKPDYAEAYWNLYGVAEDITKAKNWLERCLEADPNHPKAKLTMHALKYYEGDKTEFNELIKSSLKDHPYTRSFAWVFNLSKLPRLHFHRWALFDHMISLSKKDRPFYEFGVWRGEAFRYLIKTFKKGYGFDTFEGIPEDWHNEKAGSYSSEGNIPNIKGGEFIVGKFEDTLPGFFAKKRPMASVINFDADLYSSTICALNFAKPAIDKHTILIFDEFLINKHWEQDEYKALEEFCANNDYTYEVLAVSFYTKQVAVKLIGI